MTEHKVVVGYDGSAESREAVRWAALVADRRGLGLQVISATGVDPSNVAVYRAGVATGTRQRAQTLADEGAELAAATRQVDIRSTGVEQGVVAALVEASQSAELVVLGNRGRGRLRGALLGSSAFAVSMHAECPVAVVRGVNLELPSVERPIVVGSDGSEDSNAAILEAARLASQTGAALKLVVAYEAPARSPWLVAKYPEDVVAPSSSDVWAVRSYDPDVDGTSIEQRRQEAARTAREAAEQIAQSHADVDIELLVVPGRPERVIVEVAEDASLIVVGARGRSDFASLLLGSVSREVIHHADTVVYIVR